MDSPSPAPWTFAGRAAYFGKRVCPFCEHHAPAGAKFCNDCGSPLHLKPCKQCDAVNHHTATSCYRCGAEYQALITIPEATPAPPAADPTASSATPDDASAAASATLPLSAVPAGGHLLAPGQFLLAYVGMILIAGAYVAHRISTATPDGMEVAAQPISASEHNVLTVTSVVPDVESQPVEPDATAAVQPPIPATRAETPKRASARQRPVPVRTAKQLESAQQRPVEIAQQRQVESAQQRPVESAQQRPMPEPDPWQAMHVSLAQCGGDLIARIVCDQRVRRRFCQGHWGEAPECTSGVANDRGQ